MSASAANPTQLRPALVVAAAVAGLLATTVGLWAYYGTAVFFEMVRAGFVACF